MPCSHNTIHVSLIAIPDAVISTLSGIYDVLNSISVVGGEGSTTSSNTFQVDIVGASNSPVMLASDLSIDVDHGVGDVTQEPVGIVTLAC